MGCRRKCEWVNGKQGGTLEKRDLGERISELLWTCFSCFEADSELKST